MNVWDRMNEEANKLFDEATKSVSKTKKLGDVPDSAEVPEALDFRFEILPDEMFNEEQKLVLEHAKAWAKSETTQVLTVGGYAGTGKTTIIKKVLHDLAEMTKKRIAVAAFTGKAVAVLRRKGLLQSQTLHALMYLPRGHDRDGELQFERAHSIDADMVIVDEASMVSTSIHEDLLEYGKPILYVGDHGQLEPIGENPNLMLSPDLTLEHIHRNAGEVAEFCEALRKAEFNYYKGKHVFKPREGKVTVAAKRHMLDVIQDCDIILCGFNKTRHITNRVLRDRKGFNSQDPMPQEGEQLICINNNRRFQVYNGLLVKVTRRREKRGNKQYLDFEDDLGFKWKNIPTWVPQYGANKPDPFKPRTDTTYFDYGNVLTVHKAQGSEWKRVGVIEEIHHEWSINRHRYTAASRTDDSEDDGHLVYCTNELPGLY